MFDLGMLKARNLRAAVKAEQAKPKLEGTRTERELDRSLKHLKLATRHAKGSWIVDALFGFVRRLSLFIQAIKGA